MQQKFFKKQIKKVHWQNFAIVITLLMATIFSNFLSASTALAVSCDDIRFIFARGSGEQLNDVSYQSWKSSIETAIEGMELRTSFYELGSKTVAGYQYPAVSVNGDFWGYVTLLDAFFTGGESFDFGRSVEQGINELRSYISQISRSCPQTKFVLGGYSQGAMVLSKTLNSLDANKILYVATFGDPKIYLPEGEKRFLRSPDACRGVNLSPYRAYVPDCKAYAGVLGAIQPYQPAGYTGKLGAWCNDSDIMCSSGASIDDHIAYTSKNLYSDAAGYIRRKLLKAFPDQAGTQAPRFSPYDLVFLFDTTGSMGYMFDRYLEEAQKLAEQILASGGRVALYEYRDLKDAVPVRQVCDFGCSKEELLQGLSGLQPTGGDDINESLLSATYKAMNELDWRLGATKSIFVLTDAAYHSPDYDGTTEEDVIQKSLEIDPVNIYVMTEAYNAEYYKTLTEQTYGRVFNIHDDIELSTELITNRPVARLSSTSYIGQVGDMLTFDASASYDFEGESLRFDWDLDGNGESELQDAGPIIEYQYNQPFSGYAVVKVSSGDKNGTMSAKVTINTQAETVELATITKVEVSQLENSTAKVSFQTNAEKVLVFGNEAPLGFVATEGASGEFSVSDVTQNLELTLVPYSNDTRGVSRVLKVNVKEGESNLDIDIDTDASIDIRSDSNSNAVQIPDNKPAALPDFVVPKAPDTGAKTKSQK